MLLDLVKVSENVFLTQDQEWSIVYNEEYRKWVLFKTDDPSDDDDVICDKFSEAREALVNFKMRHSSR